MGVDILILGAGWTSTFLIPLCIQRSTTYAATSRNGREGTIAFTFDPDLEDVEPYRCLPDARTVLITFPIDKPGATARLLRLYRASRSSGSEPVHTGFILLGSTGMWDGVRLKKLNPAAPLEPPKPAGSFRWFDRHTPIATPNPRAEAESELLALTSLESPTTVLNLAGLWGGSRTPRNWVARVAPTKDALKHKGSIHLIHGLDVSRAVLAIHENWDKAMGQRWIVADGRVRDWWDLASAWGVQGQEGEGERGPYAQWVRELMEEADVRALPRNIEFLGRALDPREFWSTFGLSPLKAHID
ncbi:hypothetical protein H0H92_001431 [Tricholoma furcatifolium]|nr:hypothetical protein H0H92_001431 [Tricholoma furcatifolium]